VVSKSTPQRRNTFFNEIFQSFKLIKKSQLANRIADFCDFNEKKKAQIFQDYADYADFYILGVYDLSD